MTVNHRGREGCFFGIVRERILNMTSPVPHGLPNLGFGIGVRREYVSDILDDWPPVDWFEIVSENFLGTGGRAARNLERIAERYPIVMHGVSMSIGTTNPIDFDFLRQLKHLAQRCNSHWISDHLCWTGLGHHNSNDLLPVPYTEEALMHVAERVRIVQDFLEQPIALENPSTYLEFTDSTMTEWEFLTRLTEESGCMLLLDINNIYVSCFNHGWDSSEYLASIPYHRVVQFHLAGHSNMGTHIIDTHDDHVIDEVWPMFAEAHRRSGGRATLLEWDANIPDFATVHAEALKAKSVAESAAADGTADTANSEVADVLSA